MSRITDQTKRFIRRVATFRNCCSRIEEQFAANRLRTTDVELVYASSFLSVCAQWEGLLEAVIYEVGCGEGSRKRGNARAVTFKKRSHLEQLLLFPSKDYLGISTVKQAESLTRILVPSGMPVATIDEPSRTLLQQAGWIRNAIAHESDHALQLFRKKVPGVEQLHSNKRYPAPFLRHEFRQSPIQRRLDVYFAAFQKSAEDMGRAW